MLMREEVPCTARIWRGKRGKCKCGKVFTVPTEDEAVANIPERMCPWCGTWITADESVCEACEREAAKEDAASENAATRGSPQLFKAPKDCMPWWSSTKHQVIGGICAVTVLIAGFYQTQFEWSRLYQLLLWYRVSMLYRDFYRPTDFLLSGGIRHAIGHL